MCYIQWPKRLKSLLLACKDKESLAKIHALFILSGLLNHGNSNALLIKSCSAIAGTAYARKVFNNLPQRGIDVWNSMTVAYSRQNLPEEVVRLHRLMVSRGVKPDSSSFTVALKACASLTDLRAGEDIWLEAIGHGYELDAFVGSSALNLFAKCGKINKAAQVFDKMPKRDLVCWTTMMTGFVKCGQAREAIGLYRRMRNEGLKPDGVVELGLVQACAILGDLKSSCVVHGHLIRRDRPVDLLLQTSLIDMYAKAGKMELGNRVFRKMSFKSEVSWGTLIRGYAQNSLPREALDSLVEMQHHGSKPGIPSLLSALRACSQIGSLKLGRSVHGYIAKRLDLDLGLDLIPCTAMIDMYSKCGSISYARSLFDRTVRKDSISYNAMISGYAVHGLGGEAMSIFLKMTKTGTKPDETTFASLFSALSHSGLVEEGRHWFSIMQSEYGIRPSERHYLCLVDLLARAGRVEEAHELMIRSMKSDPGISIWVALLSGCYNSGESEIGAKAAEKILELGPRDSGVHSLVANFFAKEGKWSESAGLRKIMRETGSKKIPGQSAVDVKGTLHYFVMEDNGHDRCLEIVQFLKKLDCAMRMIGRSEQSEI